MTPRSWVSVGLQCWAAPDVLKAVIASRRVEQATSTLAIAIYGAVIATLSLGWQVFRELRDTGRLGVTLMVGRMFPDGPDEDELFGFITNLGRRPTMVSQMAGWQGAWLWRRQWFTVYATELPRMLQPDERMQVWLKELDLAQVRRLYVLDTRGRRWPVTRRDLRRARARLRKGTSTAIPPESARIVPIGTEPLD